MKNFWRNFGPTLGYLLLLWLMTLMSRTLIQHSAWELLFIIGMFEFLIGAGYVDSWGYDILWIEECRGDWQIIVSIVLTLLTSVIPLVIYIWDMGVYEATWDLTVKTW